MLANFGKVLTTIFKNQVFMRIFGLKIVPNTIILQDYSTGMAADFTAAAILAIIWVREMPIRKKPPGPWPLGVFLLTGNPGQGRRP